MDIYAPYSDPYGCNVAKYMYVLVHTHNTSNQYNVNIQQDEQESYLILFGFCILVYWRTRGFRSKLPLRIHPRRRKLSLFCQCESVPIIVNEHDDVSSVCCTLCPSHVALDILSKLGIRMVLFKVTRKHLDESTFILCESRITSEPNALLSIFSINCDRSLFEQSLFRNSIQQRVSQRHRFNYAKREWQVTSANWD